MLSVRGHPARAGKRACAGGGAPLGGRTSGRENPDRDVRARRQGYADLIEDAVGAGTFGRGRHREIQMNEQVPKTPIERIVAALRAAAKHGQTALVGFLTAGYPDRAKFREHLAAVAQEADLVEIGVPFSDPMADGVTIQRSSE